MATTLRTPLRKRPQRQQRGVERNRKQRSALRATIGDYLKNAREKKSLTQVQLAAKVGISRSYIARIEQGWREPGVRTCQRLAKVLSIPYAPLLVRAGHSDMNPRAYALAQKVLADTAEVVNAGRHARTALKLSKSLVEHLSRLPAELRPAAKMLHEKCEVVSDFLSGRASQ